MDDYPLIADHGLIGDLQTAALVTTGRLDRLVLRPALRLAERLRRAAGPTAGRPVPDPPDARRPSARSSCTFPTRRS